GWYSLGMTGKPCRSATIITFTADEPLACTCRHQSGLSEAASSRWPRPLSRSLPPNRPLPAPCARISALPCGEYMRRLALPRASSHNDVAILGLWVFATLEL